MRKAFLSIVLVSIVTLTGFAQKGDKSIGLNLGYGTEIKSVLIGAKFNYNLTDPIQLSPSFNYFLEKDGVSAWEINADMHYLFPIADKLTVYPLAGLTFVGWKFGSDAELDDLMNEYGMDEDTSSSTTKFGVNLGGGIGYQISDKISIGAEIKYSLISDFDQMVLSANVTYKF